MDNLKPSRMNNKERGEQFAQLVREYLSNGGFLLKPEYVMSVGLSNHRKKNHHFDFGNDQLLVECKNYDWTSSGNNPSAKISTLNEAMFYFFSVSQPCRKMLFLPKTEKKGKRQPETFAEYYVRLHGHFIPDDVEIWELNIENLTARRLLF